ncbi:MAG: hypothetical protein JO250_23650 [Armatimonadetes bacterium]|nr:hypothetical protein [Armatimonadota bacterium]
MDLTTRITDERDWDECVPLLQDGFLYSPAQRACLPAFWRQMQDQGRLNSALLEDRDRPKGRRILQFGVSVFVTDVFFQEAEDSNSPGLSLRVMERVWQGRSPLLDRTAIRDVNSGDGLNLLVLHQGLALAGLSDTDLAPALAKIPESFFWLHEGYRLRAILMEFYDAFVIQFSLDSGFRQRASYEFTPPSDVSPSYGRPCLLGISREEALAQPGAYIAKIFPYTPPRLFFRPGEQHLLQRALLGETDAELAAALKIAPDTVKTRWRAIYERVAERVPDLLPPPDAGLAEARRGPEKRRLLLRYLRDHSEELRPVRPPDQGPA